MKKTRKEMFIPRFWAKAALLTFIIGFSVLGYLAVRIYIDQPPLPEQVITEKGQPIFTRADIMQGQHVFQRYGLMQHGTLFGHGAYLGPDFTAQYLHRGAEAMLRFYKAQGFSDAEAAARVIHELKTNAYNQKTGMLVFTAGQEHAFSHMLQFYQTWFGQHEQQRGLKRPYLSDPQEVRFLTCYFAWAAWTSATLRPDKNHTYTNNWPPEPLAGNFLSGEALIWSVLSLIALLGGAGLLLFAAGRYEWLGWESWKDASAEKRVFRNPQQVRLTAGQTAAPWYFLVVAFLFLSQGLLGGLNAHYHVEPESFYGISLDSIMPYNLSRTWHVQLALFFITSSFLAMGIFLAPLIAGSEPRHQKKLALVLFGALVVVVFGSLLGEAASILNSAYMRDVWFWIGNQGWEYLDLGRLWQILLTGGMVLWVIILIRGLWKRIQMEHLGNMPWLFLFSAVSIPLFYSAGMFFGKNTEFVTADFWRFWVVHLWVEDFLELFTTIMVAYIFVLLNIVRVKTAMIVIYLDVILYSVGGVIGTMHHLYFSGAPALHMALGAFFSAMEVIPLLFLSYEAWRFMQLGAPVSRRTMIGTTSTEFPHKWAVMFLIAVGFWNFLGAGVFGFLINLPVVSYYEIGTQFTASHAHGALMGVYGMLAMAFFMFVARYFIPRDTASDAAMKISFWGLNIGLGWMLLFNLFPIGYLQLADSVNHSYWHARSPEFYTQGAVLFFEWIRLPGDLLFIFTGVLPVFYLAVRMFLNRNRSSELPVETTVEELTQPHQE
ncbi:MAG: cbb3-type cytochrome c oxidase subunit I [Nitrospirota bacterium]